MVRSVRLRKEHFYKLALGAIVFTHLGCAGDNCGGSPASDAFTIVQVANYTTGPIDAKIGGKVVASKLNPNEVSCGVLQHQVDLTAEVGPPGFTTPAGTTTASLIATPNLLVANGTASSAQLYTVHFFPLVTSDKAQINDFDAMSNGAFDIYLTAPGAGLSGNPIHFTTQKRDVGIGKRTPGNYVAQVTAAGSTTVLATSAALTVDTKGYYALILSDAAGGGPAVHFIDNTNCVEQTVNPGGKADFINSTVQPANLRLSAKLGLADFGQVTQGNAGTPGESPTLSAHLTVTRGGTSVFDQVYALDDTHNYAFFGLDDLGSQPLKVASRSRLRTFKTDAGKGILTLVQGIATATADQGLDVYVVDPNATPSAGTLVAADLKYGSKVEFQRLAGPYQVVVTTPGVPADIIARSATDTLTAGQSVDQIDVSPPNLAAIFYRIDEGPAAVPKQALGVKVRSALGSR